MLPHVLSWKIINQLIYKYMYIVLYVVWVWCFFCIMTVSFVQLIRILLLSFSDNKSTIYHVWMCLCFFKFFTSMVPFVYFVSSQVPCFHVLSRLPLFFRFRPSFFHLVYIHNYNYSHILCDYPSQILLLFGVIVLRCLVDKIILYNLLELFVLGCDPHYMGDRCQ